MHELIEVQQQRLNEIHELTVKSKQHMSCFVETERNRVQKENWLLKVLKTCRQPSQDQKKSLFDGTVDLMALSVPKFQGTTLQATKFTQCYINLFVMFDKQLGDDHLDLKAIIRPNNGFVVVDLLKQLVNYARTKWKSTIKATFETTKKESDHAITHHRSAVIIPRLPSNQSVDEVSTSDPPAPIKVNLYDKVIHGHFNRVARRIQVQDWISIQRRINQAFESLQAINQQHLFRTQRFTDSIFGKKRLISYDYNKLYTQEEIKQIAVKRKLTDQAKRANLAQPKGRCSVEHLRDFFRLQVELIEAKESSDFSALTEPINNFLSITSARSIEKGQPISLYIGNIRLDSLYAQNSLQVKRFLLEHLETMRMNYEKKLTAQQQTALATCGRPSRYNLYDFGREKILEVIDEPPIRRWQLEAYSETLLGSSGLPAIELPPIMKRSSSSTQRLAGLLVFTDSLRSYQASKMERLDEIVKHRLKLTD